MRCHSATPAGSSSSRSPTRRPCDLHVQAFALAERVSLPVMVCMDGFVLTHAVEEIDVPEQEAVDAFLPPFVPRQQLDSDLHRSRSARWSGRTRSPR